MYINLVTNSKRLLHSNFTCFFLRHEIMGAVNLLNLAILCEDPGRLSARK